MTWTDLLATGTGTADFRLMIEGLPYEFCTSTDMEQTLGDGRIRLGGLERDGLSIQENVDPGRAQLEASSMSVKIMEDWASLRVTKALAWQPTDITLLDEDLDTTEITITVKSAAEFSAGDVVHIGTEAIHVGGISTNNLTACTRAYWDTIAQAHFQGDGELIPPQNVYRARPNTLEGRRCRLYAYGGGDSLTGDGTLIWRGIVAKDAMLEDDGTTWGLLLDPLTVLFNQDLGADLEDPFSVRGVYYPWTAPMIVAAADNVIGVRTAMFSGFYEDQQDWLDALQLRVAIALTGITGLTVTVGGNEDEWWADYVWTATAKTNRAFLNFRSLLDTLVRGNPLSLNQIAVNIGDVTDSVNMPHAQTVDLVTTGVTYRFNGGLGTPRGVFGRSKDPNAWKASSSTNFTVRQPFRVATNGEQYLHLDRPATIDGSGADSLQITWEDDLEPGVEQKNIASQNSNDGVFLSGSRIPIRGYAPGNLPQLRLKKFYARGGLQDFRDAIVANAPDLANKAQMPFITSDDLGDWSEATEAERGFPFVTDRRYVAFDSVEVAEFLREEFKARTVYPYFDSDRKIGLRIMRVPSVTDELDATISGTSQISESRSTWERNALGSINTVKLKTGYNAVEDEHLGRTFVSRDLEAFAAKKQPRELEIAMKSEYGLSKYDLEQIAHEEFGDLILPVLNLFGRAYSVVSVDVSIALFDTLIGDVVEVTSVHLPDVLTGEREATVRGFVIGRSFELTEARGTLQVLASTDHQVYGFAPALTVSSEVNDGGNQWTITYSEGDPILATSMYQSTQGMEDHFAVGDKVRVIEWDDAAPVKVSGEVDAIDTGLNTIQITFTGAWTPGLSTWIIEFDVSTLVVQAQSNYVFLGAESGRIDFAALGVGLLRQLNP